MNKIKTRALLAALALMVAVSLIPSTYSWYNHSDPEREQGNGMKLSEEKIPLSAKSAAEDIEYSTVICNAAGEVSDSTPISSLSLASNNGLAVQYYKTTFTNKGSNDVYIDFEAKDFANNADFYVGTISPTINEKAFASRAERTKKSATTTRVYFKTTSSFKPYWTRCYSQDNPPSVSPARDALPTSYTGTINYDFNIAYKISGGSSEVYAPLKRCPKNTDGNETAYDEDNAQKIVFYADIPSNTEYFYFFNRYYINESKNKEWNSTIKIYDLTPGKLYYLTGQKVDNKWKEYKSESLNTNLVAVNQYYDFVRMSVGSSIFANIGLKKTSEDDDFIPEYYGQSISYSVLSENPNTAGQSVVTVSASDGIITPKSAGSAVIRTTITGQYGDTDYAYNNISIPPSIDQVPIFKNVRVPSLGSTDEKGNPSNTVELYWYAINKSTDANNTLTASDLYYTI